MRRSLARFSGPEPLVHMRYLADFITNMSEFRFSVHTGGGPGGRPGGLIYVARGHWRRGGPGLRLPRRRSRPVHRLQGVERHLPCGFIIRRSLRRYYTNLVRDSR
jgi:hypothetical protein